MQCEGILKMKQSILFRLVVAFMLLIPTMSFSEQNPLNLIKTKDIELKQLIDKNQKKPSKENTEKIKKLINSIFDFHLMGRKALKSSVWEAQDSASREKFVQYFKTMIENSSVKKLEVYESDSTIYEEPVIRKRKTKTTGKVISWVYSKGKRSQLIYKMQVINDKWAAWDLVIDDLSTVNNYKTQFADILKEKSFADLIEILRKKAEGENSNQ